MSNRKHDTTDEQQTGLGLLMMGSLLMPFTIAGGLPVAVLGLAILWGAR